MRFALAFFAVVIVAQSQPPSPAPGKSTKEQKQNGNTENKNAPTSQTPAQNAPVIVNFFQSPNSTPVSQQQSGNSNNPAPPDWIVRFTGILALCAIAQVVAMIIQGHYMSSSLKSTKESFVLSRPPKLIVRNIVVKNTTSMTFLSNGGDLAGLHITGQLYVANIGGTRARIREVYSMFASGGLPMARPYETLDGHAVDIPLLPGQSTPLTFPTNDDIFDGGPDPLPAQPGDSAGYVMGWVDYLDDNGNRRRTAFCRRWNMMTRRFRAITDPDYEHAE